MYIHQTMLGGLPWLDTSLIGAFVNYGYKKFYIEDTWRQCYKTLKAVNWKFLQKAWVFAPGKPFQSILMFVAKRSLTNWRTFQMLHSRVGSWPCPQTIDWAGKACQVRLAKDKHSNLLQKFVTYGRKKFYNEGTRGRCYKTFFARKLLIFAIS
jgi:hypothetical protein